MKTTTSKFSLFSICFSLAVLLSLPTAHAAKFTGAQSLLWSNPANWEGGNGPGQTAEIPTGQLVDLDVAVSIGSVIMQPGSNIRNHGGSLSVSGIFDFRGGQLGVDCQRPPIQISIAGTASLVFSGPSGKEIDTCVVINNAGRIEWSGGPVFFSGTLNNSVTGLFVISTDRGFGMAGPAGKINNAGRIVKEAGSGVAQFSGFTAETNQINTVLNNTGTVAVASGTLEIGSGTSSGNFELGTGKTLLVQGNGPHTFNQATFTGGGKCTITKGATFIGQINSSVEVELAGQDDVLRGGDGTAGSEGVLGGPGRLVWKSGRIVGKLTLAPECRSVATGGAAKPATNLVNKGTMKWEGPGPLTGTHRNEGTVDLLAGGTFLSGALVNAGTLNTFGGGTNTVGDSLVNSGVINIGGFGKAGILRLAGGMSQTATGSLYMEVGGTNASTPEFDQLVLNNISNPSFFQADGTLSIDLINNYTPPKDARFLLINQHGGKFARVHLPGGPDRFAMETPENFGRSNVSEILVSLSDAPIPLRLWGAGRDLARNESPDRATENAAANETVPQWSYGYRSTATGTNLTLFTPEQHINDGTGLHGWIGNAQATLGVNTKSTPIVFNTGSGNYRPLFPDQIYMAPGSGNEFLVVRWTAPEAGDYRVIARWLDLDQYGGNGVTAHVIRNGQEEFTETFVSTATSRGRARLRARTFSLNAGDVLDFVVGSNGDHGFDATAFNAAVRRVPKVTITTPASNLTVPEAQNVTIEAAIDHTGPISEVTLDINGETVAKKLGPPYQFVHQFEPGTHYVRVIAHDNRKAPGTSAPLEVTVTPAGTTASLAGKAVGKATSRGRYYRAVQSGGYWQNPATWSPQGVPGEDDFVTIPKGSDVLMSEFQIARELHLEGRLVQVGGGGPDVGLAVNKHLTIIGGEVIGLAGGPRFIFRTGRGKAFISLLPAVFRNIELDFNAKLTLVGAGVVSSGSSFTNSGEVTVVAAPGTENQVRAGFDTYRQKGGATTLQPSTILTVPKGIELAGAVRLNPAHVIARDGAGLIGNDGSTLIGNDGSTLIGNDGSTLVGLDGGSLIGNDGSTLIGNDGSTLIGLDGGTLVGLDGGSVIARDGASLTRDNAAATADEVSPQAVQPGSIILAGAVVTGTGELRGTVINQSSHLSPGSSAGVIVVNGDYTQEAGGTLLLEVGGKNFATRYDVFEVGGTATLGGNLIVKTIDGFTPAAADSFVPLLYGSANGSFANISSNAQVTLSADSMNLKVSGANPPAPKALNISTRMRVETGDNALIAGFIVTGSSPKKVLVRGIGPSLPVSGALADPVLSLDNGSVVNDDWKSTQEQAIRDTTIPPSSDLESAIVATLAPGPHTAILRGKNNGTGVGLVEVYDLESGTPVQLANISTRGQVQAGDNVMIGGFIIGGDYPAKVLLRAIGPSLTVPGKLEDPTLELVDANGARLTNDNWRETQEAEIAAILPPSNDKEAAIVATLVPGFYTAIVRGKDDTAGIALVEGYNLQ